MEQQYVIPIKLYGKIKENKMSKLEYVDIVFNEMAEWFYESEYLSLSYLKKVDNAKYVCFFTYLINENKANILKEIYVNVNTGKVTYKDIDFEFEVGSIIDNEILSKSFPVLDKIISLYELNEVNDYDDIRIKEVIESNKEALRNAYAPLRKGYEIFSNFTDLFM